MIWFKPDEDRAIEDFISKLNGEWAKNTAISHIVSMVVRDSDMSARIKASLDANQGVQKRTDRRTLVCSLGCGQKETNPKLMRLHEELYCKKRPLEVVIRR